MSDTPIVHQRRLRSELRKLREEAGLTQRDAAEQLEWSVSKIIRIENGTNNVRITDLRALLMLYGVRDEAKVDQLVAAARASRQKAWWTEYRSVVEPQFYSFIGYEASALKIRQYQSYTVPGLLQTADYARALTAALGNDEKTVDIGVEIRLKRQGIVAEGGPDLTFVLDEGILRRPVGGWEVMRGQLERVVEAARLPNVSVHVLRFRASEGHLGFKGSFSVFDLGGGAEGRVLVLEGPQKDVLVQNDNEQVDRYLTAFDELVELAESGDDSIGLIEEVIAESAR